MDTQVAIATLIIKAGATWTYGIGWRDGAGALIDTSAYTADMMIRGSDDALQIELSTANGRIVLGIDGDVNILLTVSKGDTGALSDWGSGTYDLMVTDGSGRGYAILEGRAFLDPAVTRS